MPWSSNHWLGWTVIDKLKKMPNVTGRAISGHEYHQDGGRKMKTNLIDDKSEKQEEHGRDEKAQDGRSSIAPSDESVLPIEASHLICPSDYAHFLASLWLLK